MFSLILMLAIGGQASAYPLPKSFPTEAACKAEGKAQSFAHLNLEPGDGGVEIAGFICIKQ